MKGTSPSQGLEGPPSGKQPLAGSRATGSHVVRPGVNPAWSQTPGMPVIEDDESDEEGNEEDDDKPGDAQSVRRPSGILAD